jgi:hypothetical protein
VRCALNSQYHKNSNKETLINITIIFKKYLNKNSIMASSNELIVRAMNMHSDSANSIAKEAAGKTGLKPKTCAAYLSAKRLGFGSLHEYHQYRDTLNPHSAKKRASERQRLFEERIERMPGTELDKLEGPYAEKSPLEREDEETYRTKLKEKLTNLLGRLENLRNGRIYAEVIKQLFFERKTLSETANLLGFKARQNVDLLKKSALKKLRRLAMTCGLERYIA